MKASIVIPVYNAMAFLDRTLAALTALEAGPHELEIVMVDDGSTDGSAERIARFPRIHLVRQANNGPARARNVGWKSATGDVVLFTDADCVPPPSWVPGMLESFNDPTVGAVGGSYDMVNDDSALARLIHAEILDRHRRMPPFIKAAGSYNLAVRRSILEKLGGFDEAYITSSAEDNDLSYRIREDGWRIAFRADCRVAHHHPERFCKYIKVQFIHGFWRSHLYRRHAKYMKGDDYSGFRDFLDVFLALAAQGSILLLPFHPWWGVWAILCSLGGLVCSEAFLTARMARQERDWSLLPLGAFVFSVRAFARLWGWLWGNLGLSLMGNRMNRN